MKQEGIKPFIASFEFWYEMGTNFTLLLSTLVSFPRILMRK